jgi:hypothetical protein
MINKLKVKEDHIKHLESILEDQDAIKAKNVRLSRQLKACELLVSIFKLKFFLNLGFID